MRESPLAPSSRLSPSTKLRSLFVAANCFSAVNCQKAKGGGQNWGELIAFVLLEGHSILSPPHFPYRTRIVLCPEGSLSAPCCFLYCSLTSAPSIDGNSRSVFSEDRRSTTLAPSVDLYQAESVREGARLEKMLLFFELWSATQLAISSLTVTTKTT